MQTKVKEFTKQNVNEQLNDQKPEFKPFVGCLLYARVHQSKVNIFILDRSFILHFAQSPHASASLLAYTIRSIR